MTLPGSRGFLLKKSFTMPKVIPTMHNVDLSDETLFKTCIVIIPFAICVNYALVLSTDPRIFTVLKSHFNPHVAGTSPMP
jgi:hypothetical protein